jgi:hypothetical protein
MPTSSKPLSEKPAAVRKRRERSRRRRGLMIYPLALPAKQIERAIRARANLPADAKIGRKFILNNLAEGTIWWASTWVSLRRKGHR